MVWCIIVLMSYQLYLQGNQIVFKTFKLKIVKGIRGHNLVRVQIWPKTLYKSYLRMLLLRRFAEDYSSLFFSLSPALFPFLLLKGSRLGHSSTRFPKLYCCTVYTGQIPILMFVKRLCSCVFAVHAASLGKQNLTKPLAQSISSLVEETSLDGSTRAVSVM